MRLLLFCLIFFTQCAGRVTKSNALSENDSSNLNKVLEREVGPNYSQTFNETKTYLLSISEKVATETMQRYVVVEVATQKVVKNGAFRAGYVRWKNDQSLELLNAPGTLPVGKNLSDYIEIISIPTIK